MTQNVNFTFHNSSRSCEHYGTNGKVLQRPINLLNTNLPNKTVAKGGLKGRSWLIGHVGHLTLMVSWIWQSERYILLSTRKHNLRIVSFLFSSQKSKEPRATYQTISKGSNYLFIWISSALLKRFCTLLFHFILTVYFTGFSCIIPAYVNYPSSV